MTKTYRDDALAARRAARARLKEFRAERLAKRGVRSAPAAAPATEDPSPSPFTVDPDLLYGTPAPPDASEAMSETQTEAADAALDAGKEDSTPQDRVDDLTASGEDPNTPPLPDAADLPKPDTNGSTDAIQHQAADLASLPCAGDGMVLLFNQCGIHSLADLATADAADLSQRLGVIGQILDLSPWIEYAREHRGAQATQVETL
ncbi:MAG: hypothetical protein AAFQ79_11610 [Pseudomonadota bacterium]